jgi:hypothetical protein
MLLAVDAVWLEWAIGRHCRVRPVTINNQQYQPYGRGTGLGTAAHWEAQPPVVAQGAAAALRTRPLPEPTASSLVVERLF